MEFTTTEHGARKLLKDGYIYLLKKTLQMEELHGSANLEERVSVVPQSKLDKLDSFVEQVNVIHILLQQHSVKQLK